MHLDAFLTALAVIVSLMTAIWIVSIPLRNVSIVDLFWGAGFVVAVWLYFSSAPTPGARGLLTAVLVTIWGARLSLHLALRNLGHGEDFRYRAMRKNAGADRYWWYSYFQVFLLQGVLMWLISAPLLGAQGGDTELGLLDGIAVAVWSVGFLFEAVSDWQLMRFKRDPGHSGLLMTTGLWRYSRHPNYFGDAAVWWAYGLLSIAAGAPYAALGSVLMTVLILRVSGVTLLERTLRTTKPGYEEYARRTSAFLPWPPRSDPPPSADAT